MGRQNALLAGSAPRPPRFLNEFEEPKRIAAPRFGASVNVRAVKNREGNSREKTSRESTSDIVSPFRRPLVGFRAK